MKKKAEVKQEHGVCPECGRCKCCDKPPQIIYQPYPYPYPYYVYPYPAVYPWYGPIAVGGIAGQGIAGQDLSGGNSFTGTVTFSGGDVTGSSFQLCDTNIGSPTS
jgi:hypothetical protein